MKIIRKIREALIHLLGGVTQGENEYVGNIMHDLGRYKCLRELQGYADDLNGKPCDEWSHAMYRHISEELCRMEGLLPDPDEEGAHPC